MTEKLLPALSGKKRVAELTEAEMVRLAAEIRETIIETVSRTGGHLAPSLGVVELTIALHAIFETPDDKIVWDVGHQSYAHKLLTGRAARFGTLRQYRGISGFPRRDECEHDCFGTGHSGTSISAALGLAEARDAAGRKNKVVAVIGDGSMTSGEAFEGLNQAGHLARDLVVVLNDNEMSISPNVGALSSYMNRLYTGQLSTRIREDVVRFIRSLPGFGEQAYRMAKRIEDSFKSIVLPGMLFEELGFTYVGPIPGHKIPPLIETFRNVRQFGKPILVHVITKKGKGYEPAETNPSRFHGVGPFDRETGRVHAAPGPPSYTAVFSRALVREAEENPRVVAISAAMLEGTGLAAFAGRFPDRCYDVGIAEQHAVTFAAGMACEGLRPVVAIYSTFLQRGYDQVLHDVCLQKLPVTFVLDRGGIVGDDGPTHHGLFDLSYLRHIPNLLVMSPKDENELCRMLRTALMHDGPAAIRYPRGAAQGVPIEEPVQPLAPGTWEVERTGGDMAVLAVGQCVAPAREAAQMLAAEGWEAAVVNARFVKPLDDELIDRAAATGLVLTVEENVLAGGFGGAVLERLHDRGQHGTRVARAGIPDRFVEHGSQAVLRSTFGLDAAGIYQRARRLLKEGAGARPRERTRSRKG